MPVSSNVATQVFAAIWSLMLLGALRVTRDIHYPFDTSWRDHARTHQDHLDLIVLELQRSGQFSQSVSKMLLSDAPWTKLGSTYLDNSDALDGEIAMMMNRGSRGLAIVQETGRTRLYDTATIQQLALLLDGLLVARFQTTDQNTSVDLNGLATILSLGVKLAESGSLLASKDWLRDVLERWTESYKSRLENNPGSESFSKWFMRAVKDLHNSWSP